MTDLINQYFDEELPKKVDIEIEPIIGIDLGTCNSCCSVWRNGSAEVISDEFGNRTIPSVISFTNKSVNIGCEARNQMLINPKNAFYEIKRLIGKKMSDKTVIGDQKFLTYKIRGDEQDNVKIIYEKDGIEKLLTPEELSAYILMKLKKMASDYMKVPIKKAVIAVPAYFNDAQRQATRDAATIAGLECVRILSEPISSALAYGLSKLTKIAKNGDTHVVVYDLGGGTLDVSLLTINDGIFEVVGSAGNTHLGGVDYDNRIYDYCVNNFRSTHEDFDVARLTPEASQKLHKACENAKKVLSTTAQTTIGVTNFYEGKNFIMNISRQKFIDICNDLMVMCLKPLDDILNRCEIKKSDITEIILVGGMTRVPTIRENIYRFFGKCPNSSINPDEIVAVGAAIQGYILAHKDDPFSESVTLLDTTPLSLGVETIGGIMNVMIPRGSLIPISEKKIFSNDTPGETTVIIKVCEGERKLTRDNFCVGEFELSGLAAAPRGYHKIEVTFTIDVDGMITVTAEDLRKNTSNTIRINGNRGRLSTTDIDKMVENAKLFEANDKIIKKKKRMYYELNELCENIIKNLDFRESHLPEIDKKVIRDDVAVVLEHLKKNTFEDIEDEFYDTEIKRFKRNYCVLITKTEDEGNEYKYTAQVSEVGTSVFQNEEDEDKTYVKIAALELGYDETIDTDKLNELRQVRDTLINMCHTVLEIVDSPSISLDDSARQELKDNVEDTIVWVHVQQKISYDEYTEKLNSLTEQCNAYVKQPDAQIDCSSVDELRTLCESLKSSLSSNLLALDEKSTDVLDMKIDEIIKWMEDNNDATPEQYQEKIDELNTECNAIYDTLIK